MKKVFLALCVSIAAAVAGGETVEISTSGWCGSGTRRKWSFHGLRPTAGAARLTTGSQICSPWWPEANVLSAAVTLACSTNKPTRQLLVTFLYDDGKASTARVSSVRSPGAAETRSFDANPDRNAHGLRLSLSDGDDGDWTVSRVSLDCEGSLAQARTALPLGFLLSVR